MSKTMKKSKNRYLKSSAKEERFAYICLIPVYINSPEKFTIALGLTTFRGQLKHDWALTMSATCMSFAPGVIFYLIGQKYFVEGIVMTGLKN